MSFDHVATFLGGMLDRFTDLSLQIHNSSNLTDMLNVAVQHTRDMLQCDRVLIYSAFQTSEVHRFVSPPKAGKQTCTSLGC
jgi:hypothetical protein